MSEVGDCNLRRHSCGALFVGSACPWPGLPGVSRSIWLLPCCEPVMHLMMVSRRTGLASDVGDSSIELQFVGGACWAVASGVA